MAAAKLRLIIWYGNSRPSAEVEDVAGVRDYLFCLGIYISGDSCWGARGAATDTGGDAVFCGGRSSLRMDDCAGRTFTEHAGMEGGRFTRGGDFRFGLWAAVLGGA